MPAFFGRHTGSGSAQVLKTTQTEPGLGRRSSPAFRTRMDFAACWMSRSLELAPPLPVRASCRPDMHSSRPPVAPASAPAGFEKIGDLSMRDLGPGIVADLRIPLHAAKTIAARS